MKNLNHRMWGRQFSKKQITAFFCVLSFVIATFGLLATGTTRRITVFYNNRCQVVSTRHNTPAQMLKDAGIALEQGEGYEVETTEEGTVVRVGPELQITVSVDGKVHNVTTRTDRVENVLEELGIRWDSDDIITPSLNSIFTENCHIQVQRVDTVHVVRVEPVEPQVVYENTDTMPAGTEKVKVKGVSGSAMVTYQETMVDGMIAESTVMSATVTEPAVDQVVLRGTASPEKFAPVVTSNASLNTELISPLEPKTPIKVDSQGVPVSYKKCIKGLATAYTAADGDLTSTGAEAQVGYVAVDPDEIPYGTMLYIKTSDGRYIYGLAKAADTGGFISGPVDVDLFFETEEQCVQFGVRDVEIYIL